VPVRRNRERAVAYLRVSTDEQEESPAVQTHEIEAWAAARGCTIVAVCRDDGVSGSTEPEDRPGFMAAIDAADEHQAAFIVASKRDRLSRDVDVEGYMVVILRRKDITLAAADDHEDQLRRRIDSMFNEHERAKIRARTRAVLQAKRRRGELVGSVPYGFRLGPGKRLVLDAKEQAVVRMVKALRAEGLGYRRIAQRLKDAGHKPRGARWHHQTVKNIADYEPPEPLE